MKRADASGAEFAVILGDDEIAAGEASLKALRREAAVNQQRVPLAGLVDVIIAELSQADPD